MTTLGQRQDTHRVLLGFVHERMLQGQLLPIHVPSNTVEYAP
jgi:hypothetical protein